MSRTKGPELIRRKPKHDSADTGEPGLPSRTGRAITIRLSRRLLIGTVSVILVVGAATAFFALRPTATCLSADNGAKVDCGSEGALGQVEYEEKQAEEVEEQAALEEAQANAKECRRQLGGLLRAEHELDSRLAVGLSHDDYSDRLGNVKVAYDRIPFKRLDFDCLGAGLPLEQAMNDYARADDIWGDCLVDFGCDMDDVEPKMQAKWAKATTRIDETEAAIRDLGRP